MRNGNRAIAETVRHAFEESGMTRAAVLRKVGMPAENWRRRISGRTPFSLLEVGYIARALRLAPEKLMKEAVDASFASIEEVES